MPSIRVLCIIMLSFLVTACGGGGSLEKEGSIGGGDGTTPDTPTYTLTINGYSQLDGTQSNKVTAESPLDIKATLKKDDVIVTGKRITFSLIDEVGVLNPSSGSALTDSNGVAKINLTAGTVQGVGEVVATYSVDGITYSKSFAFESTGDADRDDTSSFTLSLEGYSRASGSKSNTVTADAPLDLKATLTKEGALVTGERVIFTLADDIGRLKPDSGSAITDDTGVANIELTAGNTEGAGEVTASSVSYTHLRAHET